MRALFFTLRLIVCLIIGIAFQLGMPFVGAFGGIALGVFTAAHLASSPSDKSGECGEWILGPAAIGGGIGCIVGFGLGIVGGSILTALVFALIMPEPSAEDRQGA